MIEIGLVGDLDESVPAHRAIPLALEMTAAEIATPVRGTWLPTESIGSEDFLSRFHGLWSVPASPYRSMEGALRAIRFARENGRPLLGTCGGFQHGVLEYARNVLGWGEADHAESAPDAALQVITPLSCGLVNVTETVRFQAGSLLHSAYGTDSSSEEYQCRFGLNPTLRKELVSGALRVSAVDAEGSVRALELDGHPFFVLTLFQPERAALQGRLSPLVAAFVTAASQAVPLPLPNF